MSSLIVADKLTKWFGPRLAVDGVSLEVGGGEVMGLLGPNGSGKTTILRMLTGYLRPSAGTASVSGLDVVDEPLEVRRRIGYVPEDVPLYDWMRVREFLTFMARLKGLPGRAVPTAVSSVIERLALGSVVRLPIGKLSRGFRQRAAIAQALLNDPDVLVLDEPTNGLDPRQIIEMRELIRGLAGTHTLLITSHILGEIQKVADRVAILLDGRLLATHSLRREGPGVRVRLRVRGIEGQVRACLERVSGVLRQRAAIAQALLNDPDVLVLDEPTNGLDPRQIIEMRELIRGLAGTHTLLITSHILGEIQKVADRVAILLDGRLLATHSLRREGPGVRVRLRVRGIEGQVRACLERVSGVQGVTVQGPEPAAYVVDVATPSAREALAAAVVGNGFALLELEDVSADLETVFLELTGRGPAASR